ncbi:hypothetical protein V6N13_108873 [Hibiscus sabdariffa]|uniref:Dof zinc finger protein n=1 Tax=Hibiscus sabdariffa TaxID=183260 RepID=A0ABR2FNS0_9ROSI
MDTAQWPQGIGVVSPMEASRGMVERRARPQNDQALNCPRCNSTNTKFCYYNNYSLSQPRYFCKTCRRYWTEGGSLRNVPVGGGSRKNKRALSSPASSKKLCPQNPKIHEGQDLNLAYPPPTEDHNSLPKFVGVPYGSTCDKSNPPSTSTHLNSFTSTLNFSLDGFETGYGNLQENGATARLLFPMEELKQQVPSSTTNESEQNRGQGQGESSGYWSGMLGGGHW